MTTTSTASDAAQLPPIIVQGTATVVSNFALTHFSAAKLFASRTREIEVAHVGQPFGNFWQEISICASSIITAAAALEALINELYLAPGPLRLSIPDFDTFFWGGERTYRRFLLFTCREKVKAFERESALVKYKRATRILGKPALGSSVYLQQAGALIAFRNYLIHFKPLWDEDRNDVSLETALQGLFPLSPFPDEGANFLAKKCMSAGCAEWAIQTVAHFVRDFGQTTGIDTKKLSAFTV